MLLLYAFVEPADIYSWRLKAVIRGTGSPEEEEEFLPLLEQKAEFNPAPKEPTHKIWQKTNKQKNSLTGIFWTLSIQWLDKINIQTFLKKKKYLIFVSF